MTTSLRSATSTAPFPVPQIDAGFDFEVDLGFEPLEPLGPSVRPPAPRRRRLPAWWPTLTLGGAIALWIVAVARLQPGAMGAYGLVNALPIVFYAALALLTIGMAIAVARDSRLPVMLAHIAVFILVVHATPVLTYGTLRYSWAWRHIGIIDMLHRHHALVPSTPVLPIYQQWPGFFSATTALTEATGFKSALSYAGWAPPVFELLDAAVLVVLLRGLTQDRRRIALAVWFFVIANWVGQDYFSPQAFGFLLFLMIFAIVMRWYRRPDTPSIRWRAARWRDAPVPVDVTQDRLPVQHRRAVALVVLLLMAATVTSHPLTPFAIVACLLALTVFRAVDRRWPLVAIVGLTGLWLVTGAHQFVLDNLGQLLSGFGQLTSNVNSNLANLGELSRQQRIIADIGRVVVATMVVLAITGLVRRLRRGSFDRAALLMSMAPAAILAGGAYGGEAIFRAYLFALPFAAYLAAGAFFTGRDSKVGWRTPVAVALVSGILISGFLFSYYGKDSASYFTRGEVRAADLVYSTAPAGSLLVTGTLSYPSQFENIENFTYVPLSNEPPPSIHQVLKDPANVLAGWMTDPRYKRGYVLITKSMIEDADSTGVLPLGSLQRVERLLLASPKITVLYHDADALLVTVRRPTTGGGG